MPQAEKLDSKRSFRAFYDAYSRNLLGWFFTRTNDPQAAADLCAETFATALEMSQHYDPSKGTQRAWLQGFANIHLLQYQRRKAVDFAARDRLGMQWLEIDPDTERELSAVEDSCRRPELESALDRLTPQVRDAVDLRVFEELDYNEIGQRLGCSERAARVRVHRGLSVLGEVLS